MFCMHCGKTLPPDATFCPNCGQKKEAEAEASVPAPDTSASGQEVCAVSNTPAPDKIESYMNYAIVITILATFNCGSIINLALGIVALVYASKVDQHLLSGNKEKAEDCAQTAKTLCMIATGVIVIQLILVFFIFFAILTCAFLPFVFQ